MGALTARLLTSVGPAAPGSGQVRALLEQAARMAVVTLPETVTENIPGGLTAAVPMLEKKSAGGAALLATEQPPAGHVLYVLVDGRKAVEVDRPEALKRGEALAEREDFRAERAARRQPVWWRGPGGAAATAAAAGPSRQVRHAEAVVARLPGAEELEAMAAQAPFFIDYVIARAALRLLEEETAAARPALGARGGRGRALPEPLALPTLEALAALAPPLPPGASAGVLPDPPAPPPAPDALPLSYDDYETYFEVEDPEMAQNALARLQTEIAAFQAAQEEELATYREQLGEWRTRVEEQVQGADREVSAFRAEVEAYSAEVSEEISSYRAEVEAEVQRFQTALSAWQAERRTALGAYGHDLRRATERARRAHQALVRARHRPLTLRPRPLYY